MIPILRFLSLVVTLSASASAAALPLEQAEALAERMLASLGGRAAWANARNTVNDSRQDWDGEPAELRVVITMDFERPRIRIETWGRGLHVVRAIDGDRHWRLTRDGKVEPLSPELLEGDRRFHAGHVYRTLHRIARRDPAIRLAVGKDRRLEVYESGKRIAWYALDRRGQPYLYGAHDDEAGSIFGPWLHEEGGIRHPVWVTRDGGKWRALLTKLQVNAPLEEEMFTRP
jgi:hypothetical protein